MMKITFLIVAALISTAMFAQQESNLPSLKISTNSMNFEKVQNETTSADVKIFKYHNGEILRGIALDGYPKSGSFIKIKSADLEAYIGKKIDSVKFFVREMEYNTSCKIVVKEGKVENEGYEQVVDMATLVDVEFNSIKLTTPYEIKKGVDIFVGIMLEGTGASNPIDNDGTTEQMTSDILYCYYDDKDNYWSLEESFMQAGDFMIEAIIIDELADYDVKISDITPTTKDFPLASNEKLEVLLQNIGIEKIDEKFNLTVQVNDDSFSIQVSPTAFITGSDLVISVGDFDMSEFDVYKVSATIDLADNNTENNEYATLISTGIQRTVLIEEFTTEKCPQCPPVATYLNNLQKIYDNVILMAHHAGYGEDEYTLAENRKMLKFYGSGSQQGSGLYAPAGMFDRHYNGLDNDGWNGPEDAPVFYSVSPYGKIRLVDRLAIPAFVEVNITDVSISTDNKITATVSGKFLKDFTSDLGISMWIIEDGIKSTTQAGFSGEWTHHALIRGVVSETLGTALTTSTNKDDTYSMSFDYSIKDNWVAKNLSLIAFVNTLDDGDINNRTIHNAGSVKVLLSGLNEAVLDNTKIYPNPFNNEIKISGLENASEISICNIMGQIVLTSNEFTNELVLPTTNIPKGVYLLTIKNNNGSFRTARLVKQ